MALWQGKKLPKATPSRTSTKKKLHGSGKIPQTPTPEKKQKTKEDTDAEKSDNDLSIDSQAIDVYKTWQNKHAGDEASDNKESPPPDNYVHTEKEQEKYIALCFKQWGWPTNEEFQTWLKDMKDNASGYCSKSHRGEILFEIKSQALARREN